MKNILSFHYVIFFVANLMIAQELPPNPSGTNDFEENWISNISYNLGGETINKSVNFYNTLGKSVKNQTWDLLTDKIWMRQTLYDAQGRPALKTLSAPIGFNFDFNTPDFILDSSGGTYNEADYDQDQFIEAPSSVHPTLSKLGAYYNNNPSGPYQDNTVYPFSRFIFSKLNPGSIKKVLGGNQTQGEWKQDYQFSMSVGQELSQSNAFGNDSYNDKRITKTISRNIQGIETVLFSSSEGNILAAARSGNEQADNDQSFNNEVLIKQQGWIDFHIPQGCTTLVTLISPPAESKLNIQDNRLQQSKFSYGYSSNLSSEDKLVLKYLNRLTSNFENESFDNIDKEKSITSSEENSKSIEVVRDDGLPTGFYYRVYNLINEEVIMQVSPGNYNLSSNGIYRVELRYGIPIFDPISPRHLSFGVDFWPSLFDVENINYGINHCQNYYEYSLNTYDDAGRLTSSTQPLSNEMESVFKYNSLGQLLKNSSPDEGTVEFKYRKDGQIRFSQNSKQASLDEFSYTNYDEIGRPIESGSAQGDFTALDPDQPFSSTSFKDLNHTIYDKPDAELTQLLNQSGIPAGQYKQTFIYGNVSKTLTSNPSTSSIWYGYDVYGRLKFLVQKIAGFKYLRTIDYTYDPVTGQIMSVEYQRHQSYDRFIHQYHYNKAGQLIQVSTSTDGTVFEINATYYYSETGTLERTELGKDLQGIDYVYNLNGQLKAINSPLKAGFTDPGNDGPGSNGFAQDAFSMIIDYHEDDFSRTGSHLEGLVNNSTNNSYNGNIGSIRWRNTIDNAIQTQTDTYLYSYNKNNWLTGANYGQTYMGPAGITFNQNTDSDYHVSNLSYDANGNLLTLRRNGFTDNKGSNDMDDFLYNYKTGKNQLSYVEDTNDNVNVTRYQDLKNQYNQGQDNYIYNAIGQLETNIQDKIAYSYNNSGLVSSINKFTDLDTGIWAQVYKEDYSEVLQNHLDSWNVEGGTISINPGNYAYNQNFKCGLLKNRYGKSLFFYSEPTITSEAIPFTANIELNVAPNTLYQIDLDIIAKQVEHTVLVLPDDQLPEKDNPVGYTITIKTQSGVILENLSFNISSPVLIEDPDMDDGPFTTSCGLYYDQGNTLEFLSTDENVFLEISLYHDYQKRTAVYVDNISLKAATTPSLKFSYNELGHRITKENIIEEGQSTLTHYIRDANGLPLGIYTKNIGQASWSIEHPIYGANRIGIYDRTSSSSLYQLADHLGNVRSVLRKTSGSQDVILNDMFNSLDNTMGWQGYNDGSAAVPSKKTLEISGSTAHFGASSSTFTLSKGRTYRLNYHVNQDQTSFDTRVVLRNTATSDVLLNKLNDHTGDYERIISVNSTQDVNLGFQIVSNNSGVIQMFEVDDVQIVDVTDNQSPTAAYTYDFNNGTTQGWSSGANGNEIITNVNDRLKVEVYDKYHGTNIYIKNHGLSGKIALTMDIELHTDQVAVTIWQLDENRNEIAPRTGIKYTENGRKAIYANIDPNAHELRFKVEKSGKTDLGVWTHFFLDNIKIEKIGMEYQLVEFTDYYPFGMPMPDRKIESDYRYGYQGEYAEKENTGGTGFFQLRLWDSRIGRWLTPDLYGEFSSPYIGMGNNPLKYVDIDGGRIFVWQKIGGKMTRFEYKNGDLFYADSGDKYTGSDSFLNNVKNALSTLDYGYQYKNLRINSDGNSSTVGFINSMVTSKDIFTINYQEKSNKTNGLIIYLDPDERVFTYTMDGRRLSPFFITLGHEIGHAWDNSIGIADDSRWYNIDTTGDGIKNKEVKKSEQFASAIENMFRGEHKLPLRKYYSMDELGGPINSSLLLDNLLNTIFTLSNGNQSKCKCGN